MQRPGQEATVKALSLKEIVVKRRSSFAEGIAAEEFGGRYFGWRQWREFEDLDVEQLEARRYEAIWSR